MIELLVGFLCFNLVIILLENMFESARIKLAIGGAAGWIFIIFILIPALFLLAG
jgi:hypothetical protein